MAIIISDIHGEYEILNKILEEFKDETLIFLGDIIDRGLNSKISLKTVLERKRLFPEKTYLIRGNHEDLAREALKNEVIENSLWFNHKNGGDKTLKDYGYVYDESKSLEAIEDFKKDLWEYWYLSCDYIIFEEKFYISHAAIKNPLDSMDEGVYWSREQNFPLPKGLLMSIHGHTIVQTPVKLGTSLYIDLGSFHTGKCGGFNTSTGEVLEFTQDSIKTITRIGV